MWLLYFWYWLKSDLQLLHVNLAFMCIAIMCLFNEDIIPLAYLHSLHLYGRFGDILFFFSKLKYGRCFSFTCWSNSKWFSVINAQEVHLNWNRVLRFRSFWLWLFAMWVSILVVSKEHSLQNRLTSPFLWLNFTVKTFTFSTFLEIPFSYFEFYECYSEIINYYSSFCS